MTLRKHWRIKMGTNTTIAVTVPGRWMQAGQSGTWIVKHDLARNYKLGLADVTVFTAGTAAAYRLKKQQEEALRHAQQPFMLLRPSFAPTVSPKE